MHQFQSAAFPPSVVPCMFAWNCQLSGFVLSSLLIASTAFRYDTSVGWSAAIPATFSRTPGKLTPGGGIFGGAGCASSRGDTTEATVTPEDARNERRLGEVLMDRLPKGGQLPRVSREAVARRSITVRARHQLSDPTDLCPVR